MEARTIQHLLEVVEALDSVHEWRTISDDLDQREKMAYMLQEAATNMNHIDDVRVIMNDGDSSNEEKANELECFFIEELKAGLKNLKRWNERK